eukprot:4723959-Pyramimonas_sp.AAC.1
MIVRRPVPASVGAGSYGRGGIVCCAGVVTGRTPLPTTSSKSRTILWQCSDWDKMTATLVRPSARTMWR